MIPHDPNGIEFGQWRRVFQGYEADIESKAGACPPKTAAFARQLAVDKLVEGPWETFEDVMPEPREPNCPDHDEPEPSEVWGMRTQAEMEDA